MRQVNRLAEKVLKGVSKKGTLSAGALVAVLAGVSMTGESEEAPAAAVSSNIFRLAPAVDTVAEGAVAKSASTAGAI